MTTSLERTIASPETTDDERPLDVDLTGKTEEEKLVLMTTRRENFFARLVAAGEISPEYLEDPQTQAFLAMFVLSTNTGRDSLMHTLIGDDHGGLHHLRAVHALALGDRMVASDPTRMDEQEVIDNGVSRPLHVGLQKREGEFIIKPKGSSQYPAHWSTEQVLRAMQEAMQSGPADDGNGHSSGDYHAHIDGVEVKVGTKILRWLGRLGIVTAYPKHKPDLSREVLHDE